MKGLGEGEARQSKAMSASSSVDIPSPLRADFQLSVTDFFLDFEIARPALKMERLKADQEGREMSPEERSDQADKTWGQKGPSSKSFRDGSLGAGTAISTLGGVKKQSDHKKKGSEGLRRIGKGGVGPHPS